MKETVAALGPHGRAAIATLVGKKLSDEIRRSADNADNADAAVEAMKRWVRGERVTGRQMSNLVYSEAGEGVALHTMRDAETDATPAWTALTIAVMYVAWQVYRATGEPMPEDMSDIGEDTLNMLDGYWRATGSYEPNLAGRAAALIGRQPDGKVDIEAIEGELRRS